MDSDESQKAMIYDAHALLQKVEDILASIIQSLPKEYTNFRLHHRHKEMALVHRISSLNVQLEPLREASGRKNVLYFAVQVLRVCPGIKKRY